MAQCRRRRMGWRVGGFLRRWLHMRMLSGTPLCSGTLSGTSTLSWAPNICKPLYKQTYKNTTPDATVPEIIRCKRIHVHLMVQDTLLCPELCFKSVFLEFRFKYNGLFVLINFCGGRCCLKGPCDWREGAKLACVVCGGDQKGWL